jgi:hypothetical protein
LLPVATTSFNCLEHMRAYVGSPGTERVWVTHRAAERSGVQEALDELLDVGDERRTAVNSRFAELEQRPEVQPLHHRQTGSVDGLSWGDEGAPGQALAAAILAAETGEEPTERLAAVFRDDVLARLGRDEPLELPATAIWMWIEQHRTLVEAELFNVRPAQHPVDADPPEPAEPGPATASALVAACEHAWETIRSHHPELPDAVVVVGSGVERGRLVKLGHWWGGRWVADGGARGEVLLAGEALHQPPADVFEILLHEAAHALNAARGIKDTSRGGRYHNQRYKAAAEELLLRVRAMPPHGLARTLLTDEARGRYATTIDRLGDAMRIARRLDAPTRSREHDKDGADEDKSGERSKSQAVTCTCGCGRRLRVAPTVLAVGPIHCGRCDTDFTAEAPSRSAEATIGPGQRARIEAALDRLTESALNAPLPLELPPGDRPLAAVDALRPTPSELAALDAWYRAIGDDSEAPMPAQSAGEAERLSNLARAVLVADGTLSGPSIRQPETGRAYQAGDHVIVTDSPFEAGFERGTLGRVEHVDLDRALLRIDFATAGRIEARVDSVLASSLDHDYAELDDAISEDLHLEVGL